MQLHRLHDRIARGLGAAARQIGAEYDAFRPAGVYDPLAAKNRYLRLPAAFADENLSFRRPSSYGRAIWSGIFDSAYTKPGDYLAGPGGVFFIAAQQSLLPTICVLTTATITLTRPAAPTVAGVNSYGGLLTTTATPVLMGWPASILFAGSGSPGDLPGDAGTPNWTILLPTTPVALRSADLITDDAGKCYVVGSAELTALGWRLLAKLATT